jgi:hypothetical protein
VNKFSQGFIAGIWGRTHSIRHMNAIATLPTISTLSGVPSVSRKERFRQRFQRSLRSCVRRGFSVEESFGMIWVETWEELALTEHEQSELYDELINWAKNVPLE